VHLLYANCFFRRWIQGTFTELKKATVAHIRDSPSQNKDSELCDEDVGNNCLGSTVIPQLTSDPANEFFGQRRFFFAVFRTRLTNMDSANVCFSGCAR